MFKAVYKIIFRFKRLFALGGVLFFSTQVFSFQLDSESIVTQRDHFSNLEKKAAFKKLNEFISFCIKARSLECLKRAQAIYINPEFMFFKNLVSQLVVSAIINQKQPLKTISFLNKGELNTRELIKIFKNYKVTEVESFFGKDFFMKHKEVEEIFLKEVGLLCKFLSKKEFIEQVLKKLSQEEDFFSKDFSSFPCGLKLVGGLKVLDDEIKKFKKKRSLKETYKFSFLKEKVLKAEYKRFSFYPKRTLAYRIKNIWKNIFTSKPPLQEKVIKNLFYNGEYKLLSGGYDAFEKDLKTLKPESLQYVVKSLIALGEYEKALSVSGGIKLSPFKAIEEIKLMRGSAYLRLERFAQAEVEFRDLVKNAINLELSGLYWLRVSLKKQKKMKELKNIDKKILRSYPFSYYGLMVAFKTRGKSFFNIYKKNILIKQSFASVFTLGEEARLNFYYAYKHKNYFKKTFKNIEPKLNPLQKALFALVFKNLDDQLEVIRGLNLAWDLDGQTRAKPFVLASFPMLFQLEIKKTLKGKKNIDSSLLYSIIRQESAFQNFAQSSSGARGLMQLLPSTAKDVSKQVGYRGYEKAKDLYKPDVNIYLGATYIQRLIRAGKGYVPYAVASYNAGPGRMYRWSKFRSEITDLRQGPKEEGFNPIEELWIEELPWSETRFYTKAILRNIGIYLALKSKQNEFNCYPFWSCIEKKP